MVLREIVQNTKLLFVVKMHFTNVKAGVECSSLGFKQLIESCHDLCFSILSAVISA